MIKILVNFQFFITNENRSRFFNSGEEYSLEYFQALMGKNLDFLLKNKYIHCLENVETTPEIQIIDKPPFEGTNLESVEVLYKIMETLKDNNGKTVKKSKVLKESEIKELGLDFEKLLNEQKIIATKTIA